MGRDKNEFKGKGRWQLKSELMDLVVLGVWL
ncbi:Uncharacterised protein [Vibrio cholerae]|nr:Uncharacterised protein [Vibrio cholerae]CSI62237.1 Uncharacterised protein [Vibrio cholerae]